MPAPPALLDGDMELKLVPALTKRGYDVTSIQIVGPRSLDDAAVLARATELGRVLLTHNGPDFRTLDAAYRREGRTHSGVVELPQLRGARSVASNCGPR